ncbi:hypothetical protein Xen7305DRAFT_00024930 [Xenococcus sp. PCC 7305]|uniref:DUF4917 family protein n=1 Tax=Xenococcus sp. PCC 7305 TaxID=102125 RepID=UPI0002AC9D52|nr:DUF4917 family protein [Xenococcus sp. PCC 7305]ELS02775.1 hypothetical protein Xen7305DRAFT_00024930 [Xenococcus sp. PCC 7305]
MELKKYSDVIEYLRKKKRPTHLLLGNGFSMAYDSEIFSYNALHRFIDKLDNELLTRLFEIVNTKNFELVLQQLENFCELIDAFGTDPTLKDKVQVASKTLKESLIEAIEELHPEHVFKIPQEKSQACSKFLSQYLSNDGHIFTTNYDVLLYWVLMRNSLASHIDGFGRDVEYSDNFDPDDEPEASELRWGRNKSKQNVHYMHGALHIFDTGVEIIKEEYDCENYIMDKIKKRLLRKQYPVFVTAGTSSQKLEHVMHNRYLSECYESLCNISGSLVVFGFGFGEYDEHIIEAINKASRLKKDRKFKDKLWSIYIGVNSSRSQNHIEKISDKFECKVNIFDAKTARVWG